MNDEPLSVAQAAQRAGVNPKTIRRAIDRGDLRALHPGGRRRIVILEEDFVAWRDEPVVPRAERTRDVDLAPVSSRRSGERGSLATLRAMERSSG